MVYELNRSIVVTDIGSGESRMLALSGRMPRWQPDGRRIAYIHDNQVMVVEPGGGGAEGVAKGERIRALVFAPDNHSVVFSDGRAVRKVHIDSREVTLLLKANSEVCELDIDGKTTFLATTEKTLTGYRVRLYILAGGQGRTVSRGCSASLDPRGERVTSLVNSHQRLNLHNTLSLQVAGLVTAPAGKRFDNHF